MRSSPSRERDVHLVTASLSAMDDLADRAVLRDGSVVLLRLATPADHAMLARFFHDLSLESRRRRFLGFAEPSDKLLDSFCTQADVSESATLLAMRLVDAEMRPIAVGSYFR